VPRAAFIPDRCWAAETGETPLDRAADPDAWSAAVRSDVTLVTQYDDGATAWPRVGAHPTFGEDDNVFAALRLGAAGFLLKDAKPRELREAVRTVASGDALLSPGVTRSVIERLAATELPPGAADRLGVLTDREREVLALVGQGMSNQEIGARLHLSPATARTHVGRLLAKLSVRDRVGLVVLAYETGLVRPGDS
jgi:DNA-binding NarL/FixJ family response regulator